MIDISLTPKEFAMLCDALTAQQNVALSEHKTASEKWKPELKELITESKTLQTKLTTL